MAKVLVRLRKVTKEQISSVNLGSCYRDYDLKAGQCRVMILTHHNTWLNFNSWYVPIKFVEVLRELK